MKDIKFYDTSALLAAPDITLHGDKFVISSITLAELENIKTARNKDNTTKYRARYLINELRNNPDITFDVVIHAVENETVFEYQYEINNDMKILSDAIYYNNEIAVDEVIFVTNDLLLAFIANLYFGDGMIEQMTEQSELDDYTGFKTVCPTDEQLSTLYTNPFDNQFDCLINEYLIIKNSAGEFIDVRYWDGNEYRYVSQSSCKSDQFGNILPKDIYQKLALDSFNRNKITYVGGPAGSGKSILALGYLFSALEKGRIDKIVIFCNPVVARHAAKLG